MVGLLTGDNVQTDIPHQMLQVSYLGNLRTGLTHHFYHFYHFFPQKALLKRRKKSTHSNMSSEGVTHARTRSSERLNAPGGGVDQNPTAGGSMSPPPTTTTTTSANAATGGGSSATTGATTTQKASQHHHPSMLQFSEHAINQVQGLSKRGLDLPITARLQRRRYRWDDESLLLFTFLSSRSRANIIAHRFCLDVEIYIRLWI